ncbi:MAG: GxxExxY protein [Kiritimatiellia bacterium]
MADEYPDSALTEGIIKAAITVHSRLGPGFLESAYEEALCIELRKAGIPFERQKAVDILYDGHKIAEHRLDMFVAGRVVVELKAILEVAPIHYTVVRSYLKATGTQTGLLFNFFSMPLMIKRVGPDRFSDPK